MRWRVARKILEAMDDGPDESCWWIVGNARGQDSDGDWELLGPEVLGVTVSRMYVRATGICMRTVRIYRDWRKVVAICVGWGLYGMEPFKEGRRHPFLFFNLGLAIPISCQNRFLIMC